MLQIRTTNIERFRRFRHDPEFSEEKLLKEFTGQSEPSRKMVMGTAFHKILEDPELHEQFAFIGGARHNNDIVYKYYEADDFIFPGEVIDKCLAEFKLKGIAEIQSSKLYNVSGQVVKVTGTMDLLHGIEGDENKSRWSDFDMNDYFRSLQWRFYMDIFEIQTVRYNVAEMRDMESGVQLIDIHKFSFDAYPGIEADCINWLEDLVQYIHIRGLEEYFLLKEEEIPF